MDNQGNNPFWLVLGLITLVALIVLALVGNGAFSHIYEEFANAPPTRQDRGEIFGSMPKPIQPTFETPIKKLVKPPRLKKALIKRIPRINPGAKMPHAYWGSCIKCHLIRGGAPAGSQPASPVAKVWEKASSNIMKVGPPILPDSARPHPASGRCIKCHDVLVQVQAK